MKAASILLLSICSFGFANIHSQGDEEDIQNAVIAYFKAIEKLDFVEMKSISTSDFLLFENGTVMNNDSLIQLLKHDTTIRVRYKLEFIRVQITNEMAVLVYRNYGSFFKGDTLIRQVCWLESVTINKINDEWKLSFLHSTKQN